MAVMKTLATLALLGGLGSASIGFDNCSHLFVDYANFEEHQPAGAKTICRAGALAIAYDPFMVNPAWSAYHVTPQDVANNIPGRKSFYEDPDLLAMGVKQAPRDSDAFNQSWNRGHLAPSHMMSYSQASKQSCYTMANVAPQQGFFNQHPWNQLETKTFEWVGANHSLHIITGISYNDRSVAARTYDNIAVPDHYWKVLCDVANKQSVGFIGMNSARSEEQREQMWVMRPVKEIETAFGGKLFPEAQCNTLTVDESHWFKIE